ncbi:long-chain fatty acid--CoA ligase [Streptomyces sp. A012304]|uniref:long-chain-fatty-acid--CoA ligase n=1 Tax=Streptomyces sp. A012304 TaxID=375446 RepID=UPI00223124B1|nr:long-chain fatty acid--CoA ligase [Streptomyces sp. A012304]GKQ39017.1 long-chain-fatty-acid--CoA ligase [Streptomyces sp. A012304]
MLNLAVLLENTAREAPDRDAVVLGGTRLTYAQIDAEANRVAAALSAHRIGPGDRVALSCPNLPYFAIVYYGILKAGATIVPLNVLLTEREIAYHLQDSGATAYFCFEGTEQLPIAEAGLRAFESTPGCEQFVLLPGTPSGATRPENPGTTTLAEFTDGMPAAFDTVQTAETDTAVILYTSGTTGAPKGAELTHSNMVHNALMASRLFAMVPDDVQLLALPLFHSFGQTAQLNAGFATGTTIVLMPRFDARAAIEVMVRERITFFAGVPTMYWALLNCEDVTGSELAAIAENLRLGVSGGSALPVEVLKSFEERFCVPILEGYGLSETSPIATFNRIDRPRKPGSIGFPAWGVEVSVVRSDGTEADVDEPGEIRIRGHNVMKGYLDRPEATAEAIDEQGWFRTGDVGRRDADGYLYIVDRTKDLIIRGGFNVYPRELEEVLLTHPAVSLAAVVGVPHASHGEEVKAFVIRKPGATATEADIVAWCRQNMAGHKYPRIVEFRDGLPMTATGKILKRELADRLSA